MVAAGSHWPNQSMVGPHLVSQVVRAPGRVQEPARVSGVRGCPPNRRGLSEWPTAGHQPTGFIPFRLRPHAALAFGGATNVLAVMADNRSRMKPTWPESRQTDLPWNSPHWHPAHGGIYRNVYLTYRSAAHHRCPSTAPARPPAPTSSDRHFRSLGRHSPVEVPVQNGRTSATREVVVQVSIARASLSCDLKESQTGRCRRCARPSKFAAHSPQPQLWEPGYPYLYRAVCTLSTEGKPADSLRGPFWHPARCAGTSIPGSTSTAITSSSTAGAKARPSEWPGLGAAQPDWMHLLHAR